MASMRRGLRRRVAGEGRQHRIEQRQTQGDTGATEKIPTTYRGASNETGSTHFLILIESGSLYLAVRSCAFRSECGTRLPGPTSPPKGLRGLPGSARAMPSTGGYDVPTTLNSEIRRKVIGESRGSTGPEVRDIAESTAMAQNSLFRISKPPPTSNSTGGRVVDPNAKGVSNA